MWSCISRRRCARTRAGTAAQRAGDQRPMGRARPDAASRRAVHPVADGRPVVLDMLDDARRTARPAAGRVDRQQGGTAATVRRFRWHPRRNLAAGRPQPPLRPSASTAASPSRLRRCRVRGASRCRRRRSRQPGRRRRPVADVKRPSNCRPGAMCCRRTKDRRPAGAAGAAAQGHGRDGVSGAVRQSPPPRRLPVATAPTSCSMSAGRWIWRR